MLSIVYRYVVIITERMTTCTLFLSVEGTEWNIEENWIDRWEFLSNFVSDMGRNHTIFWTSSDVHNVADWVTLNRRMDNNDTKYDNILSLSDCLLTVTYMMPIDGEYLQYCHVDDKITKVDRKKYFEESG